MDGQWLPDAGVRSLRRYLVAGDGDIVFVIRKHWIVLVEPIASAIAGGILMLVLVAMLSEHFPEAGVVVLLGWLFLLGRAFFHLIEWQFSWFGSTQRRLLLTYGLLTRKVAMMPLEKVTDMSYSRSPLGQLLGYGEFVLESAGQDQALRTVTHLPDPDALYRELTSTMFDSKSPSPKPKAPPPEPEPVALFAPEPAIPPLPAADPDLDPTQRLFPADPEL